MSDTDPALRAAWRDSGFVGGRMRAAFVTGWNAATAVRAAEAAPLDVLLRAVEELDNCWTDQGDHIEWDADTLPERLIALRKAYAPHVPERWSAHPFRASDMPDRCAWTDGRWSACKAPAASPCHIAAMERRGWTFIEEYDPHNREYVPCWERLASCEHKRTTFHPTGVGDSPDPFTTCDDCPQSWGEETK